MLFILIGIGILILSGIGWFMMKKKETALPVGM